ncbi:MAG: PAS domain S-box protein [Bacteroidia bacterium]
MIWGCITIIILLVVACILLFLNSKKSAQRSLHYVKELHSFENIVNHTHDSLFVIEIVNGKLFHVNIAAADFLGYTPAELMSKTYFDLLPKSMLAKSAEIIADVWEQKGLVFTDIPLVHKSGEIIPVESSARIGSFDEKPAIVIYARDMRERLRYENEIKEINRALTEKNREITDSIIYAKRIQTTLITSEKYIEKTLNRLMKRQ